MEKKDNNKNISYLSFQLGEEIFASHVSKVINILEVSKITKVPKAPDYMRGVINLRGTVLPVIDTRIKFGMEPIEFSSNTCIIVLEVKVGDDNVMVGSLVDGVHEVFEADEDEILPSPNIGYSYRSDFIIGMVKEGEDSFVMILNMDLIFTSTELVAIVNQTKQTIAEESEIVS